MAENENNQEQRAEAEATKKRTDASEKLTKKETQLGEVLDDVIKRYNGVDEQLKRIDKSIASGRKRYTDVAQDLASLREAIEDETDVTKKAAAYKELAAREEKAVNALKNKLIIDSVGQLAKGVATAGLNVTKSVINSYQSNASAFQMAGDAAIAGIDATQQTIKGITGVANTVGTSLMFIPGPAQAVGAGLLVASAAIGFFSEKASELAKFGIQVAQREMEKTVKSFSQASAAGALFADGLKGLRDSAAAAMLTQDQFSEVIAKNHQSFANFGGSVNDGIDMFKQVSAAMGRGPNSLRGNLLKLGLSMQEIAESIPDYMGMIAAAGVRNSKTPEELAQASASYLENIKALAAFTGEDVKKAKDRATALVATAGVQTELNRMQGDAANNAARLAEVTAGIPEEFTDSFRQMFGPLKTVVNKEMAALLSQLPATREFLNEANKIAHNSALSAEDGARDMENLQKKYADQMRAEALKVSRYYSGMADTGKAGAQSMAALSKLTVIGTKNQNQTNLTQADRLKLAKQTDDKLTKGYANSVEAAQDTAIAIQKLLTPAIENFASLTADIIKGIEKTIPKGWRGASKGTTAGTMSSGARGAGGKAPQPTEGSPEPVRQLPRGQTENNPVSSVVKGITESTSQRNRYKTTPGDGKLPLGEISPELQKIYENALISKLVKTGDNDTHHYASATSLHPKGKAADFSLKGMSVDEIVKLVNDANAVPGVKSAVAEDKPGSKFLASIREKGGRVYENAGATALHMHLEAFEKGGVTKGPSLAGEAGPEAVIPLPDGRTVPVKIDAGELISKMNELIKATKDNGFVSEKMLRAIA